MKHIFLIFAFVLAIAAKGQEPWTAVPLSDEIFARMQGRSWPKDCTLDRAELRYLTLLYNDAEGKSQKGEMVVNRQIATKVVNIFRKLYDAGYRIERMRLIDDYDADDERSMSDNNTSGFCYRRVAGQKSLSKHARGMAIDLNPRYNPCVKRSGVQPSNGKAFAHNRGGRDIPFKIDSADLACRLFKAEGFRWGGDWRTMKDYQHFEY